MKGLGLGGGTGAPVVDEAAGAAPLPVAVGKGTAVVGMAAELGGEVPVLRRTDDEEQDEEAAVVRRMTFLVGSGMRILEVMASVVEARVW